MWELSKWFGCHGQGNAQKPIELSRSSARVRYSLKRTFFHLNFQSLHRVENAHISNMFSISDGQVIPLPISDGQLDFFFTTKKIYILKQAIWVKIMVFLTFQCILRALRVLRFSQTIRVLTSQEPCYQILVMQRSFVLKQKSSDFYSGRGEYQLLTKK